MRFSYMLLILSLINSLAGVSLGDGECGPGGPLCASGFCCSKSGYCGTTSAYCGKDNCQSQCPTVPSPPPPPPPITPPTPPSGGDHLTSLISRSRFEEIFKHRGDPPNCQGSFYTYDAFIEASKSFTKFAAVGNTETRKREVAAFLAQTSHETTGGPGWAAPDGPYAWGYCFIKERFPPIIYCDPNSEKRWPCAPGKTYIGRGPMQLSWNFNYGQAGEALKLNLLKNPDLVTQDPVISFKTAFWFWMTPQSPKPSCHDVVTGQWTPSAADIIAGRKSGYGVITNIINGGMECNKGENDAGKDRIGFYLRYCKIFDITPGPNLDCYQQRDFNLGLKYVASY